MEFIKMFEDIEQVKDLLSILEYEQHDMKKPPSAHDCRLELERYIIMYYPNDKTSTEHEKTDEITTND
jgi:hypothetical protein